jgi:hypothetical protein
MSGMQRQLTAIYYSVNRKERRIVFRYHAGRWNCLESFQPLDIRDALQTSLERIEEFKPGTFARAASLDDTEFQSNKLRTRRYISEDQDLLYIECPHLKEQSLFVAGYWIVTNISWGWVPNIIRLACQAAEVGAYPLSDLKL